MRFLFVDRIHELTDREIWGEVRFAPDTVFQYPAADGKRQVAPGVISEAIGQLVSWHCIKHNQFTARPVFLFCDRIEVQGLVRPGDTVNLFGKIERQEESTFVFSGNAKVGDRAVCEITSCSGYFMPLGDLEDPAVTQERFNALTSPNGLVLEDDGRGLDFTSLIDEVIEKTADKLVAKKTMRVDEPFYADHFPRFPVTPIVMINEMIGQAATRLVAPEGKRLLMTKSVSGVKIKSFVKPGETCEVKVQIAESKPDAVVVVAEIIKQAKMILRGKFEFNVQTLEA